jgi:hypothetical protein
MLRGVILVNGIGQCEKATVFNVKKVEHLGPRIVDV